MNSFLVTVRRRGRIPCFWLLPVLLLFVSLHSEAAFSASLTVKIRQVNPDSGIQQVTCTDNTKCLLPIDVQTKQGEKETLTALILFVPGRALFEFQASGGFLYAWDNTPARDAVYETLWHSAAPAGKPSTGDVTLFLPAVPRATGAPILNVAREAAQKVAHQPVADLEITVVAAP